MNPTHFDLAHRLELANAWRGVAYAQAQGTLDPALDSTVEPLAGGYLIFTGALFPVNRATGLGFRGPVSAADMDHLEQFYHRRGIALCVDLCPLAHSSLLDLLDQRGYRLKAFYSVLALALPDAPCERPPTPVEVKQIGPEESAL